MKIKIPSDAIPELRKLIRIKNDNIFASDVFLNYLLNSNQLSLEREFKRRSANANYKDQHYASTLVDALASNSRQEKELLLSHLDGRCALLSSDYYQRNAFLKAIDFSEQTLGKWRLTFDHYSPFQAFTYRDIHITASNFEEKTRLGFFEENFSFPVIMENDRVWMSVTPHEIETMEPAIEASRGVVVVMGLGLGYFPFMIAQKEGVKKVVIFEKDKDIIVLFSSFLLPQFPNNEKITVVQADALLNFNECLANSNPDYVFIDIWQSVDDGLPLFVKFKEKEKEFPATRFSYWIEKSLIAMMRRVIITIFEEALEGYMFTDYQKVKDPIDEIFSRIFEKLTRCNFNNFDDISQLLTDEGIDSLLKQ
ncbi:MAG: hypothetical protein WC215_00275 [Bacilli bacterium]